MTQSTTETPRTPLVDAPNMCALYSPEPIIHDVTPDSGWPLPVASLAKALALPLPSCIQNMVDSGYLSRFSNGTMRDNHHTTLDSDPQPDSSLSSNPVLVALPFVLNAARELREVMRMNRLNEVFIRPTIPIWFSLVRLLAHICSEDLAIISDTPYILPRAAPLKPQELITDGWATGLISVIVESAKKDAGNKMDTTSDEHVTHESGFAEDNETVSEEGSARSDISSRLSLDVPFAAHMLPGHGRRLCAVLPIICIADESNIYPLLTSALYQRRVWNIDEPVIGLVISRTGTAGQVYLAWLDARSEEADGLPTPNIACATSFATSSDSHPSLGLFDLGDSISALLFAQFILGISWQVREIKSASSTPCTAPLSWRCDDPIDNIRALEDKQWKHTNNIASWARDVAATSSDTHSLKSPTLSFHSIMSPAARVPSTKAPSTKAPSTKAPSTGAPSATRSKSDTPGATSGKKKIYLSNSVLAGQLDIGLGSPTPTFVSFEFERGVVPISSIQLPEDHSDFWHLCKFLAEYKDMLKFTLMEGWAAVDDLPVVNGLLHTHRHRLWEDHAANYNLEKTRLDALPDSKDPKNPKQTVPTCLDPSLAEILESRLDLILAVTYGMSLQMYISGRRAVYESEWRYQWDTMQYKCYVTAKELISTYVLLERHLNFSRNRAVDFPPKNLHEWAKYRRVYCALATVQYDASKEKTDVLVKQYEEAFSESLQILNEVKDIVAAKSRHPEFFKDRAAREPRRAICDSFLFVPIAGALASSEPCSEHLKNFGLVEHTGEQEKLINPNARNVMLQQASATKKPIQSVAEPLPATRKSTLPSKTKDTSVAASDALQVPGAIPRESRTTRTTLANVITPSIGSLDAVPSNSGPEEFPNVPPADALLLPDLVSEYKKQTCSEMQAVNQTRSYLIASVTFLASIGIKDHRVFGLATNGPKGGVLMAWWAKEDDKIYIIERDIHTFDISTPTGAVQFAIFLIRLRADNAKIRTRFAEHEKRKKTIVDAGKDGFERWTKAAQATDLKDDARFPEGIPLV